MLLMEFPSTRGEDLPDYSKNPTWNLLNTYIDAHLQILIEECRRDGVNDISRLKSQCANTAFSDQIIYNRMFQQVIHKGFNRGKQLGKIFQNDKALEISVGNSYTEDQLRHNFL